MSKTDITYTLQDVGCYVDGARGIYAIDAIVEFAESHGFTHDVEQTPTGMPGDFLTYSRDEFVGELEDEVDEYMNEHYPADGAYWGRSEQSDWGLWPTEEAK
jgi:hypothetical protein